jgi:hypothetical protein
VSKNENFQENSQAIQAHLNILQSVIQRMAANSSSSKAWCITLASAILVIVADKGKPEYAFIAIIPTLLFLFLDSYYLALEKGFRNSYDDFISKLHSNNISSIDLFSVKPTGKILYLFLEALKSPAIWPFYMTLLLMVFITKKIVL